MIPAKLTQSLKAEANRLGFDFAGCCPAIAPVGFDSFSRWLDAGYAGEMSYLEERKSAYRHPDGVMPGAKSLMMLGMNYQTELPRAAKAGTGRISRYAWGDGDYHDFHHKRLKQLKQFACAQDDRIDARGVVDTAPLLEREFAQLAGLGWQAKNTMLINKHHGSWFFLSALLLNVELEYDQPFDWDHCGTCTACLDACPTNAFPEPGVLDATKCISYLTIEHRSQIPLEFRESIGDWVFGCDVCQEVCPWNRKSTMSVHSVFHPLSANNPMELRELFFYDEARFRERFRKTPLWRAKRRGILRNAAIVLGNQPADENLPALEAGVNDAETLVRGASAWSLGRHDSKTAADLLEARLKVETELEVCKEIRLARELNACGDDFGTGANVQ